MRPTPVLALILLLHFGLALAYAASTPYRTAGAVLINPSLERDIGAPDERQHANYVAHLLAGRGFPVFVPGAPDLYETYQSHQPPLYYMAASGWARLLGVTTVEDPGAGLRLRALNALVGTGTVLFAYLLGFWGFRRVEVGLGAAAFAGLLPMMAALSGAISNDPLLILVCTAVLALCARGLREGWDWPLSVSVGILLGLGFLTKTSSLALVPAVALAALYPGKRRAAWKMAGAAALIALAIASPWWVRNTRLYGDPLAIGAFNQAFVGTAQKEFMVREVVVRQSPNAPETAYWRDWVGWWTFRSFYGVFGYMDVWLTETGTPATGPRSPNVLYRLLLGFTAVAFLGWLWAFFAKEWRGDLPVRLMNLIFAAAVLALFVRFNMQYFQAQGRYLLPAIGPVACGVSVGLLQLARLRGAVPVAIVVVLLLAINAYALIRLPDEFATRIELYRRAQAEQHG
jgi:4-amino-4-deoxy-L-arabinose transferase-like glycosyltransferase